MRRTTAMLVAALLMTGCGDGDGADRAAEPAAEAPPGDGAGTVSADESVTIQNAPWFREGGILEFNGRQWIISGEPVFDPAVEQVGEYQGTPLFAEPNVAPPRSRLFVPLGDDYWQMLEPVTPADVTDDAIEGLPRGVPGVEPTGDPTDTGGAAEDGAVGPRGG